MVKSLLLKPLFKFKLSNKHAYNLQVDNAPGLALYHPTLEDCKAVQHQNRSGVPFNMPQFNYLYLQVCYLLQLSQGSKIANFQQPSEIPLHQFLFYTSLLSLKSSNKKTVLHHTLFQIKKTLFRGTGKCIKSLVQIIRLGETARSLPILSLYHCHFC